MYTVPGTSKDILYAVLNSKLQRILYRTLTRVQVLGVVGTVISNKTPNQNTLNCTSRYCALASRVGVHTILILRDQRYKYDTTVPVVWLPPAA